jgi:hypothetical protein
MLLGSIGGAKRVAEAGAEHEPEDQWRSEHADDSARLAVEAYDFPPPQRERGQDDSG